MEVVQESLNVDLDLLKMVITGDETTDMTSKLKLCRPSRDIQAHQDRKRLGHQGYACKYNAVCVKNLEKKPGFVK